MAGKDSTVLKVSVAIVYASFLYEDVSQFTEKGTTVSMQRKKSFLEVLFFRKTHITLTSWSFLGIKRFASFLTEQNCLTTFSDCNFAWHCVL